MSNSVSFKRNIHKLSQFPTAKGHNAHKLKELLLKMGTDAERSPELAKQYKEIIDMFTSQYEAKPKKKASTKDKE
jgi:hypothetical protein